jgi:hypothetical protein
MTYAGGYVPGRILSQYQHRYELSEFGYPNQWREETQGKIDTVIAYGTKIFHGQDL